MILSVSRRTDIPKYYSKWFIDKLKNGYVYVRNPYNPSFISDVSLDKDKIDAIVFWTKDARPMMEYIDFLKDNYYFYFNYTITGFNTDLEENAKDKSDIINNFIELSNLIGKNNMVLRYDPIILNNKYTIEYHTKAFERLCSLLHKYTNKVVISFFDEYKKNHLNSKKYNLKELNNKDMIKVAESLSSIAQKYNLILSTCAEEIDLSEYNITRSSCIDGHLIEKEIGIHLKHKNHLDRSRPNCLCMKCIDIGEYNTCLNNCIYCYATTNKETAYEKHLHHYYDSPLLRGKVEDIPSDVKIQKRNDNESFKDNEVPVVSLFDMCS